jgi:hypothetical protein
VGFKVPTVVVVEPPASCASSASYVSYNYCCTLKHTNCWAGLMLSYLYLPLTHLVGGQNCVTWVRPLGWQAGHRCRTDCAGNAGTPAQLTIQMPGPMGHGLEMPYMDVHLGLVSINENSTSRQFHQLSSKT